MVADLVLWSNYILVKLHIVTDIKVKQWCGGRILVRSLQNHTTMFVRGLSSGR